MFSLFIIGSISCADNHIVSLISRLAFRTKKQEITFHIWGFNLLENGRLVHKQAHICGQGRDYVSIAGQSILTVAIKYKIVMHSRERRVGRREARSLTILVDKASRSKKGK